MKERTLGISPAGAALFAGALAWALQQQGGYVIASWACGNDIVPVLLLTAAAVLLLALGGWLSWHALEQVPNDPRARSSDEWRPRRFLGIVALMGAFLFLFTILMQAVAAFFLPGCVG